MSPLAYARRARAAFCTHFPQDRLYKEEKLTVRKTVLSKAGAGAPALITIPQGANKRWSVDFASNTLSDSRRFRVCCVIDDFTVRSSGPPRR